MGFELLSRKPKQRHQEIGCLIILALFGSCAALVAVSVHRAGVVLKPVCDVAVVGKRFDRRRFEAEADKRGVYHTFSQRDGYDIAWADRRTLLYPKLCIVRVKDGIVQDVRFETYLPP